MQEKHTRNLISLLYVFLVLCVVFLAIQLLAVLPPVLEDLMAFLWRIIFPVLLGLFFAYLLIPLLRFYGKRLSAIAYLKAHPRQLRGVGIFLTYLTVVLVLGALGTYLVPLFILNISEFIEKVPQFKVDTETFISQNATLNFLWQMPKVQEAWLGLWASFTDFDTIVNLLDGSLLRLGQGLLEVIFALVLSVYILLEKENLQHTFKDISKVVLRGHTQGFFRFCTDMDLIFGKYMTAQITQSFLMFAGSSFVMLWLGVPYAILLGFLLGVLNIIPYVGPILSGVLGALFMALIAPRQIITVIIVNILAQMIDGWVLGPKIFEDKIGLSPFWSLAAITLCGAAFGFLGMMMAVPLFGVLRLAFLRRVKIYRQHI